MESDKATRNTAASSIQFDLFRRAPAPFPKVQRSAADETKNTRTNKQDS